MLRALLREARMSASDVRRLQFQRLKSLLIYANDNFAFYRERFSKAGFDPYLFSRLEQLREVPVLTKEEYREFVRRIVEENPRTYDGWYRDATSGSTGIPLQIWRTWDERAYMIAKWMRVLYLNGYRWTDTTFSLPSPYRIKPDSVLQRLGIMRRSMIPFTAPPELMVSEYIKARPDVLYGNKSPLVEMASFAEQNGFTLPQPKFYVCAAETLDSPSRELLTRAFGPNLSEVYGAVEFNTLAWRARGDDVFRVSHTTDVLELVDDEGMPSNEGHCVVTDLFVRSFPLIRYQLGDHIEAQESDGLLVLKSILGRMNDWVVFGDGSRKPFHSFWKVFRARPEIWQFRVIQESLGRIRVILVKDPKAPAGDLEAAILVDLRKEIGDKDMTYEIEWIDRLPPDPNGKLRVLISKISA